MENISTYARKNQLNVIMKNLEKGCYFGAMNQQNGINYADWADKNY